MGGKVDLTKLLIVLLILGNLAFLARNGMSYYDREIERADEVERQHTRAARVRGAK